MDKPRYDLAVIGAGPGGYVAAIRATQLKMKVAVVERDNPGGVCLNWGCIPSKALLNSAETIDAIRAAGAEHGIEVGEVRVDFKRVIARSREAADKLARGVRYLLKKNNIDLYEASGTLAGPHTLALAPVEGKPPLRTDGIEAHRLLLASGSTEQLLPGMAVGDGILTSREALAHDRLPSSVLVIGAGAVGAEFAYFYHAFGSVVTVAEMAEQMLPGHDREVAEELRRSFTKRGINVLVGHRYKSAEKQNGRWRVELTSAQGAHTVESECVLVAVGRRPLSGGLGLEKLGVEFNRAGFVTIDDSFRTTCPSVYAIGDVARTPLLAHKASAEGIAAVEIMAGVRPPGFDLLSIAGCIYCEPEIASVGLSEEQARAQGLAIKVGKIPMRAMGKAVAVNRTEGFVKLVAGKELGEVLGCQIIGWHATDLISEVVLGRTLEATTAELGKTVHPHPTLSEAIMEAALAAEDQAINV